MIKKNDFVEIKYTGYTNGNPFDSNIEEDLKKINPKAKVEKTIVIVGEGMVVPGFDKALEGKETGKEYEIKLKAKEGFGERKREMIKLIPLKIFHQKQIDPKPGMVFNFDNNIAKVIAVSGARVTTDFNNPLAGKEISYKFTIVRKVEDEKEKCTAVFEGFLRFAPEFEVQEKKVVIKGDKTLEMIVKVFGDKFKTLIGKELAFELKEVKKDEKKTEEKKN